MKSSDRSQNADRRILIKLMKPVAALFGCLALFVPVTMLSAATVEYDLTIARQEVNFTGQPVKALTINGRLTKDPICGMTVDEEHLIARLVCSETVFGLACKKRNSDHATKFISRLNPFSERGPP